ncbi:MAG: serpin family protein [Bifidobacteriaceae bacterium]|jgi:serpin B|nr:serpin family protein [Bifidobacteriaceae bacterium]
MRKRRLIAAGAAAATLLTTMACGVENKPGGRVAPTNPNVTHQPLPAGAVPEGVSAIAYLGQRLLPLLQAEAPSENLAFSPTSIFLALAMAGDGARGQTTEAFEKALGLDRETAHALATELITDWAETQAADQWSGVTMSVADAAWLAPQLELLPTYSSGLKDDYGAEVATVDFADPGTLALINEWIADKTNQLIPEMLAELDPGLVLMLVNAMYLKAPWLETFSEEATDNQPFTLSSGEVIEVPTMHGIVSKGQYFNAADGSQGAVLPYANKRFALLAVMPAEGVEQINWADGLRLNEWLDQAGPSPALTVSLPKWETGDGTINLIPSLEALGLGPAFAPDADFGGMVRNADGLHISEVKHAAVVKTNETGTEAAAATMVGLEMSAPGGDPATVSFDRPFVYAIMDLDTGVPLFMGVVANPVVCVASR